MPANNAFYYIHNLYTFIKFSRRKLEWQTKHKSF
nr:MAG TPA: hypothetical protein [Caudoviricetes sp.]